MVIENTMYVHKSSVLNEEINHLKSQSKGAPHYYTLESPFMSKISKLWLIGDIVRALFSKKIDDYDEQFAAWTNEKKFVAPLFRYHTVPGFKQFIDKCIENHIKPEDCKHSVLLMKAINGPARELPYLFEVDGDYHGIFKKHTEDDYIPINFDSALVVSYLRKEKNAKKSKEEYFNNIQLVDKEHPTTKDYYTRYKRDYKDTWQDLNKVAFAFFADGQDLAKEDADYLRAEMTRTPDNLQEIYQTVEKEYKSNSRA